MSDKAYPPRRKAIAKAVAKQSAVQAAMIPLFGLVAALAALVQVLR
jgi:uncharacterized protein (DUF2062 family)